MNIVGIMLIAALALFAIWYAVRFIDTLRNGLAPDIGTPSDILPRIYSSLALKPHSVMYELGCGDARVLCYCAQQQPKATFVGIENGMLPYIKAKWQSRNLGNVSIRFGDLRKVDLKEATHLYLYLLPEALVMVEPNLPQRSRIVSCQFPLADKKPKRTINIGLTHPLAQQLFIY